MEGQPLTNLIRSGGIDQSLVYMPMIFCDLVVLATYVTTPTLGYTMESCGATDGVEA